ncbi:hypothetical protein FIBSPDRAFT_315985 [Athelia psychrophila]|uniref:Uncharacterized protein n=1 Tax=Athelia psychrophila TaxID=1759441 RepID=A0A166QQY3_9AGAM|nr:hypothetical protein FIBSPDRAFT_315985 [Fibularhizoctonia sp. CBS 109695]
MSSSHGPRLLGGIMLRDELELLHKTLDSSRLQPSDYVNLAGTRPKFFTPDSTFELGYMQLNLNKELIPFPENSSGFLYLSALADKPQSAWEIRFRVTHSNAPQSFKSGVDLIRPDQKPWHIPLRSLGSKVHAALWELLLRDGLVDDALLHVRPFNAKQHIQTLYPSRLHPSDHLNISGSSHLKISAQESPFHITYTTSKNSPVPFPDYARGFLYLYSPVAEAKAMWEIRFRVTNDNCPSSFKSGWDLLYPNLNPWAISLGSLRAHHPNYLPLRDLLIHEGLDVDALLEKIGITKTKKPTSRPVIDYSLAQRFCINFERTNMTPTFITYGGERLQCAIQRIFDVGQQPRLSPYSGLAWCRFEAYSSAGSTQPDRLAIRILEMITL